MCRIYYKYIVILIGLTLINGSLFSQVEGESDLTTLILKRPGFEKTDSLPPEIKIISPRVDTSFKANISASDIYLIGRLTDESGISSLSINGEIIKTDENGYFQKKYDLLEGLNVFKINAVDTISNSCTRLLSLINRPSVETDKNSDFR